ncbi:hypothetical protein ABZ746_10925 [Streptomyces sp. NPDC020096]
MTDNDDHSGMKMQLGVSARALSVLMANQPEGHAIRVTVAMPGQFAGYVASGQVWDLVTNRVDDPSGCEGAITIITDSGQLLVGIDVQDVKFLDVTPHTEQGASALDEPELG